MATKERKGIGLFFTNGYQGGLRRGIGFFPLLRGIGKESVNPLPQDTERNRNSVATFSFPYPKKKKRLRTRGWKGIGGDLFILKGKESGVRFTDVDADIHVQKNAVQLLRCTASSVYKITARTVRYSITTIAIISASRTRL